MAPPLRLSGRTALVTGGAHGIGAAIAERFAAEGCRVAVCDVADEEGRALAEQLDGAAEYHSLDVAEEGDWVRVVGTIEERWGGLQILVNNAGIRGSGVDLCRIPIDDWETVLRVNQTGSFLGLKHCVPALRRSGGGSIVQVSSIFAVRGQELAADYSATKAAVALLARNAAVAYASAGVRVNVLHPGLIDTPMSARQRQAVTNDILRSTPLGRPGTPGEVAAVAAFLASDDSSFITGADIFVDGGYNALGHCSS